MAFKEGDTINGLAFSAMGAHLFDKWNAYGATKPWPIKMITEGGKGESVDLDSFDVAEMFTETGPTNEEILRATSARFDELSQAARIILREHGNLEFYDEMIAERAKLIMDLPDKIKKSGKIFPAFGLARVSQFAKRAEEALLQNSSSNFLRRPDSKEDDPNELEG